MAQRYAIADAAEARAYLAHPILGARYVECVEALQDLTGSDPVEIFGEVDAVKLRSSLTLFEAVSARPLFAAALKRWSGVLRDERTLKRLGAGSRVSALEWARRSGPALPRVWRGVVRKNGVLGIMVLLLFVLVGL